MVLDSVKDEVLEGLRSGKVELTFTKVDGEQTTRIGTLNPDLIGSTVQKQTSSTTKTNPGVCPFYQLGEVGVWRCFRWDNLVGYRII